MNILIVSVDYFPAVGGISMMTHYLADALSDNHAVKLLAPADAKLLSSHTPYRYELIVDTSSRVHVRESLGYVAEDRRIQKLCQAIHTEFTIDRILLMHPFYYGPAILKFGKDNRIPVSCYFHGFELRSQLLKPRTIHDYLPWRQMRLRSLRASTMDLARTSSQILVNSSVTGELVKKAGRPDYVVTGCGVAKSDVEQHWIPVNEKEHASSTLKAELNYNPGDFLICFLGRLVESKNLDYLIRALAHTRPDIHLAICGPGDDTKLKETIQSMGLESRVRLTGGISEAEKWQYLGAADLLGLPSIQLPGGQIEGFGIVMLEATIRATAIIASDQGGMKDFVAQDNGFYIDISDPRSGANTIERLAGDTASRSTAVRNAQSTLLARYTWDKIAQLLESTWQQIH